jgi:hypothetical protein
MAPDVATMAHDFEARWLTFRRKFKRRFKEICVDGHKVNCVYIFPECRMGDAVLRRVHVILEGEEPVEFYLAVKTRRKSAA